MRAPEPPPQRPRADAGGLSRGTGAAEHPADVLRFVADAQAEDHRCALVVVTGTIGGAVRAPGALMAVTEGGVGVGYVSGGCVDADIVLQARQSIAADRPGQVRYGRGSPFFDIRLPCGGTIDLLVMPDPAASIVRAAATALAQRQSTGLRFGLGGQIQLSDGQGVDRGWREDAFEAHYEPRLRIRIAGRGPELIALVGLALAAGFETVVQSPDDDSVRAASMLGVRDVSRLTTPNAVPAARDDPWTAVVLMFHDSDWETGLLGSALAGDAFYVGALGSRQTHARRCGGLRSLGVPQHRIDRIRAPIGLIPSMRDASTLAISTIAEVVAAFHQRRAA